MNKPRSGFASVLMISLLPSILSAGMALFATFSFLRLDLATLNVCRAKQLETQNKIAKHLERLLKLNPRALHLRLAQHRAEKALILATQSASPPLIAAAEARLLSIKIRRQFLDNQQKNIIEGANLLLRTSGEDLSRKLHRESQILSTPLVPWFNTKFLAGPKQIPSLAVEPDALEVAPLYEPRPNFEEDQSWQQQWTLEFMTTSWVQKYLNIKRRFTRSCSTSIHTDGIHWIAHLRKDKSLLKAFY